MLEDGLSRRGMEDDCHDAAGAPASPVAGNERARAPRERVITAKTIEGGLRALARPQAATE